MIDFKKLVKKLLFLPVFLIIIFVLISAGALVFIFVKKLEMHPVAYAVYVFSFYTLSVFSIFCYQALPKRIRNVRTKVYNNKYGNRYFTDIIFKTHVTLYRSLSINLLYVAVNIVSGILTKSFWFLYLAGYYVILSVLRYLSLKYLKRNEMGADIKAEWKLSRFCSGILTLLNLILTGVIPMMMFKNRGFEYYGILIYVMAMYTFYITTVSIINIVKYRKYMSPVMTMTKIISLAAALVSMLALETAMLTAFGQETPELTKRLLIAFTGAGISITVIVMSCYMIIRSSKELNKLKKESL